MNASVAIEQVKESVDKVKSNHTRQFPEAASIGDSFRQGDIYITLQSKVPTDYSEEKNPRTQLAIGNTQGSRHCLENLVGVKVYRAKNPDMLEGPYIKLSQPKVITHPEHGHVSLPIGVYSITYQRNLDELERVKRVQD